MFESPGQGDAAVGVLAALGRVDPRSVDQDARIGLLEVAERCRHAVDAWQQQILGAVDCGQEFERGGDDWVREEVAAALGIAPGTAVSRLAVARGLVDRFPATLSALESGTISYGHARVIVEETHHLDDDLAVRVERRVLPKAAGMPVGAFRGLVERAADRVDPATAAERHAEAREERRVWRRPVDDGMMLLAGVVPAEQGVLAWHRLDQLAYRDDDDPDDHRTVDQRRADVFVDLLTGTHPTSSGDAPTSAPTGPAMAVEVVVSADTLQGISDGPAVVEDRQTLTADQARTLAYSSGARWRRLVIDPRTGYLLACGEKTYRPGDWRRLLTDPLEPIPPPSQKYRPPTKLARYVRKRDRYCTFMRCGRRAAGCDIDHRIPWPRGETSAENLGPECRRHHRAKHHAGWTLTANEDGSYTWTSAHGREYTTWPHDYRDDT